MLKDKYYYELTLLIRPDLEEEGAKKLVEKIEAIASKENPLFKKESIKKIKLVYPIKKQNEAFLACLGFQSEGIFAIEFKKQLDTMPEVLRFLLVKKKVVIEEPEKEIKVEKPKDEIVEPEEEAPVKKKASKKEEKPKEKEVKKKKETEKKTASMEEIEKDLEKILGE